MLTKGIDSGFTDTDAKQGIVTGYFAMFNNKDLDGDIIERGAFSKTVSERGPNGKQLIKYLLDHKKDQVVAKITELYEDEKGLRYTAKIGSHTAGQDFQKMIESELLNQHSFGFSVPKDKQYFDQARKANIIKEFIMYEGSAIQFLGANPETTFINLKSFEDALDQLEKLDKFIRTSDATDETLKSLELKLISLTEYIKAGSTTLDDVKADNTKLIIDIINKSKNGF